MISSVLRPRPSRQTVSRSSIRPRSPGEHSSGQDDDEEEDSGEELGEPEDSDQSSEQVPLLPLFSSQLDTIPVFLVTHSIRSLIVERADSSLTWEQLRSPQVSAFLIKPILQQILAEHMSRATIYALMANHHNFLKDSEISVGGPSKTRAMLAEILAMKLLKEYSTRELIDVLSFDFYPLQGAVDDQSPGPVAPLAQRRLVRSLPIRMARISALELAIKSRAKKFLANPLVTAQVDAIWRGNIIFENRLDSLHRTPIERRSTPRTHQSKEEPSEAGVLSYQDNFLRRSVTLYDPRDASLFKLSRLRVPRYRSIGNAISLLILLVFLVAVLKERCVSITGFEVFFWFWSLGYILDGVVGFSQQGGVLYISLWSFLDLGILSLLASYYAVRLYGIFIPDTSRSKTASQAYDLLGATAVLLFPRLFSILDGWQYFSQLTLAFRIMAADLVALALLVMTLCSGFFVAFSLSFAKDFQSGRDVVYALFQIFLGFTPAAWGIWDDLGVLGKIVMTTFLVITHFLILTLVIMVLTNSFLAISTNAYEEHQYLMTTAIISQIKSPELFSYIAPSNLFSIILWPLKFLAPFRRYVYINRLAVKISNLPVLVAIYTYESLILSQYEPSSLVQQKTDRLIPRGLGVKPDLKPTIVHPRAASIVDRRTDQVLDEVFRRPVREESFRRAPKRSRDRKTSNIVNHWMSRTEQATPEEQDLNTVDRLENRRATLRGRIPSAISRVDNSAISVVSDPEEYRPRHSIRSPRSSQYDPPDYPSEDKAGEGDDELGESSILDRPSDEFLSPEVGFRRDGAGAGQGGLAGNTRPDYFQVSRSTNRSSSKGSSPSVHRISKIRSPQIGEFAMAPRLSPNKAFIHPVEPRGGHNRNTSTNTVLFSPVVGNVTQDQGEVGRSGKIEGAVSTVNAVADGMQRPKTRVTKIRIPKSKDAALSSGDLSRPTTAIKFRPVIPDRTLHQSVPNLSALMHRKQPSDRKANAEWDIGSDLVGLQGLNFPATASSYGGMHTQPIQEDGMMGRLMLARMKTLEESIADVAKGVKEMRDKPTRRPKHTLLGRASRRGSTKATGNNTAVQSDQELAQTPKTVVSDRK